MDDELFQWKIGQAEEFREGELAKYMELRGLHDDMVIPQHRLMTRDERYSILLNPSILTSDDAILAVLIHETHELEALEDHFAARSGRLSTRELRSLVDARVGKLHCEAWDEADRRVLALIEEDRWP